MPRVVLARRKTAFNATRMPETSVRFVLPFHSPRPDFSAAELTDDDIAAIDRAGSFGARQSTVRTFVTRAISLTLVGAVVFAACSYMGIDLI